MLKKGDPKLIRAWTFYDWANSVYPLVISSAIFPIFYEKVTQKQLGGIIHIFGTHFTNTEFYSYIAAISYLIVAASSPVLSGIADYSGSKKRFLQFFCFLGAGCTIRDGIRIAPECVIGAGIEILADTEPRGVYVTARAERLRLPSDKLPRL